MLPRRHFGKVNIHMEAQLAPAAEAYEKRVAFLQGRNMLAALFKSHGLLQCQSGIHDDPSL
jgi:hypothetical protein